jgi:hypothetical protein
MKDIGVAFFHHGRNDGNVIVFDLGAPLSESYNDGNGLSTDMRNKEVRVQNHAY